MLSVNEVFQDVDSSKVYRVLWIDDGNVIAYLIDIYHDNALPFGEGMKNLFDGFVSGRFSKVVAPNLISVIACEELSEKEILIRDKAWNKIKELVKREPEIYKRKERGKLIKGIIGQQDVSNKTIYKYLKRYWQRGKVKDALIPDYKNCGNKGVEKNWGRIRLVDHEREIVRV